MAIRKFGNWQFGNSAVNQDGDYGLFNPTVTNGGLITKMKDHQLTNRLGLGEVADKLAINRLIEPVESPSAKAHPIAQF